MRFAFYGRVSTEDQQDPTSSKNWQLTRSRQLIEPAGGEIIAEFFDIGQSRSLPWKRRPEAARLLDQFASPSRDFDAVVIGEPQRAFYGNQFGLTFPVFVHYGVELWVPEVGGRVDPGSDAHDLVMSLYGGMSKGERNRIKTRVRTAMAAQAAIEGRFLGGRPPYGYVLADAGPHPNPGKAAIGQRLHVLDLDPAAAPVVQRIFAEYIGGAGIYRIAEALTGDGILSPSAHDPARNRHRVSSGGAWSKQAVRSILTNPRYTGRQVWNRQRRDEVLIDVEDVALGHETRMRWNPEADWVWSEHETHPAIVTVDDFDTVRDIFAAGRRGPQRKLRTRHPYALAGIVHCGVCGRKMQSSWNNGRAYYRCKFPAEYAIKEDKHPKTVYLREDAILPRLDGWIGDLFDPAHLDATCAALAHASDRDAAQPPEPNLLIADQLRECEAKLRKYRQLLEERDDIAVIGEWIAEAERERNRLQRLAKPTRRTAAPIAAHGVREIVEQLQGISTALNSAEPNERRAVYDSLGVTLTYYPDRKTVHVSAGSPHVLTVGVGGAIRTS